MAQFLEGDGFLAVRIFRVVWAEDLVYGREEVPEHLGEFLGYPLEDGDRVVEVDTNAGGGIELQLWGEGVPMCVCGKGGTPNGSRCTCVGQVI